MIDRDQVLHVARLARLRLTDEELERMPGELSKILEDVPRPCLPRERALAGAPDVADGGFRVPSPGGS